MKQRIAFLYLNTGGGHLAPARALAAALGESYASEDECFLLDGFSDGMRYSRFFFETGYSLTSNYFEPGYVLFYRVTELPLSIRFGNYLVALHGVAHIARFIRENAITKVVCLHEVLSIIARTAIDRVDSSIPLITMVTDPFTAHALWFYQKNAELVVFSEKLREEAIQRYGFAPDRVRAFPFILSRQYERPYGAEELALARARFGLDPKKKVLLVAGGGEGLKGARKIVAEFLDRRPDVELFVVCGKNALLRQSLSRQIRRAGVENVRIFGFVPFMCDLLNICDCVITKGGASTVMETLAVGKPVIFSTFIRGQELGNVLFAVHRGAGWYLRDPKQILDQALRVMSDPNLSARTTERIAALGVRNGLDDVARFIHEL